MRTGILIASALAFVISVNASAQDLHLDPLSAALAKNMLLTVQKDNADKQAQINADTGQSNQAAATPSAGSEQPQKPVAEDVFWQGGVATILVQMPDGTTRFVSPGVVFADHWRARINGKAAVIEDASSAPLKEKKRGH